MPQALTKQQMVQVLSWAAISYAQGAAAEVTAGSAWGGEPCMEAATGWAENCHSVSKALVKVCIKPVSQVMYKRMLNLLGVLDQLDGVEPEDMEDQPEMLAAYNILLATGYIAE